MAYTQHTFQTEQTSISEVLLEIKVYLLGMAAKLRMSFLRIDISGSLILSLNKDLVKTLLKVNEKLERLDSMSLQVSTKDFLKCQQALIKFKKIYFILEKDKFFNNNVTNKFADEILLKLYDIEFKERQMHFDNSCSTKEDKVLIDLANHISLATLSNYHDSNL